MKTTTKTQELKSGGMVSVELKRGLLITRKHWDGYDMGEEINPVDRLTIKLIINGKTVASGNGIHPIYAAIGKISRQALEAGCDAHIGDNWYSIPQTTAIIRQLIAECEADNPKCQEQIDLEQAATDEKTRMRIAVANEIAEIESLENARRQHPGWCEKCGSYCYGDCTAN